jgi:TfoX/Sxy family transcriptional regulator of competence genes
VAHDPDLAERIRALLAAESGVSEQRMFGGVSFLVDGHMAIAASGQGGILVRTTGGDVERLALEGDAEPAVMGTRRMRGWVRVSAEKIRTDRRLAAWVTTGVAAARSLPPKRAVRRRS